ncbi:hypothetical protein FSP39_023805 [Pinctada imbricata]|uniref:U3 small nucleolar ribonucleoprotein protein MPP10 n=1 Tax=Pinctada imbricata TaxID=66713 RepID=A0AA88Y6Q9_PINIB|nr:hypothetical protein FSP39_023805 [Pinctada imbricata]
MLKMLKVYARRMDRRRRRRTDGRTDGRRQRYASLRVQTGHSKTFRQITKDVYDVCKDCEIIRKKNPEALPELITEEFDEEQIWQQIELQNQGIVNSLLSAISGVATSKNISFQTRNSPSYTEKKTKQSRNLDVNNEDIQDESDQEKGSDTDAEIDHLKSRLQGNDHDSDNVSYGDDDDDDDLDFDFGEMDSKLEENLSEDEQFQIEGSDTDVKKSKRKKNSKQKGSIVDDKFFKLADMEAFLDQEDAKEMRKNNGEDEDVSSDEDDIDMFVDETSDEEDGEKDQIKYEDFFDPPDFDDEISPSSKGKKSAGQEKRAKNLQREEGEDNEDDLESNEGLDEEEDEAEETEEDNDEEDEDEKEEDEVRQPRDLLGSDSEGEDVTDILGGKKKKTTEKSSFEKHQEKLKDKISKMEDASIAEKPWQLAGEITATSRPENSLLEEHLIYDQTVRLPPVITEETTQTLEEMIRRRIKDKAWDDVERKVKPTENPFEYKKRITLDQEKSKQSLGEIYEQEYLKQQKEEEEDKEYPDHTEIKDMMKSLFIKLDALSNFHYTPKPAAPDIKIVSNLPTISMEEVAPVTHSNGTLLAPEEVKNKTKGELKGKLELSDTDRQRARRQKKVKQRMRKKEKEKREKLVEKLNPGLGNKYSKEKAMKELEKKQAGKSVTVIKEGKGTFKDNKKLTSSKSFFTQLQEDARTEISKKKVGKRKSATSDGKNSKKYKL